MIRPSRPVLRQLKVCTRPFRMGLRIGPLPVVPRCLPSQHRCFTGSSLVQGKSRSTSGEDSESPSSESDMDKKESDSEKDERKDSDENKNEIKDDKGDEDNTETTKEENKEGSVGQGSSENGGSSGPQSNDNDDDNSDNSMLHPVDPVTGLYPPLLAIPMRDRPPLPGRPFAINITDSQVIKSIFTIIDKREPYFVLFHVKEPNEPDTDVISKKEAVHEVGVHCQIIRHTSPKPGLFNVLGYPLERCKLEELSTPYDKKEPEKENENFPTSYLKGLQVSYASVKPIKDEPYDKTSAEIRSLVDSLKTLLGKMGGKNPLEKLQIKEGTDLIKDPSRFADFVGSTIHGDPKKIQEILETFNIEERLNKALELLKVELRASLIKESAIHNLSSRADDYQTKLFIKEFIRELQKRVGINESEDKKTAKFDERVKNLKMTDEALEAYKSEKQKMESQNEHSSELGVTERYLDWLTSIPWGIYSKDRFNVSQTRHILEKDHYGLKEVKERILEFISMAKIAGRVDGKILCLIGPPGTGKTSIARSIAESLNRRYVRIAMGGLQDVHEIKGHRRTYVGSIPGRIIFALKQAKTSNPLMLIDEIDKLDLARGGSAASAFLEILDPEQNNSFVDNYLDVKVDLSKVLFVCTANYLGTIPPPLRDRMEIIDVTGYTNNEKAEICERHIIPSVMKKSGLKGENVTISKDAVWRLIEKYCRESGLRNVKKLITRIFSRASLKIIERLEEADSAASKDDAKQEDSALCSVVGSTNTSEGDEQVSKENEKQENEKKENEKKEDGIEKIAEGEHILEPMQIPEDVKLEVTPENLKEYVGPEVYTRDRVYDVPPPGVATGLSYSASGNGDALYIESILTNSIASGAGNPGVQITGSLKDIMKESATIAYSFSKLFMAKNYPDNRFFEAAEIHTHCPDGAVPKDGPSAGIAFTSSLLSLAFNQSLPPTVAMTGEITVTGRVLPVGGLREKILGAKRYGCDTVIFPKDIENELEEIPTEVKSGVNFVPVEWYQQVFERIFPNLDSNALNNVWKEEFSKLDQKKKNSSSKKTK